MEVITAALAKEQLKYKVIGDVFNDSAVNILVDESVAYYPIRPALDDAFNIDLTNGHVITFQYDGRTINFIGVKNFEMAAFYYSENVGCIIDCMIEPNLKITPNGLWTLYDGIKVNLSQAPEEICHYLNLNFKKCFSSVEEKHAWAATCQFYRKECFEVQHTARKELLSTFMSEFTESYVTTTVPCRAVRRDAITQFNAWGRLFERLNKKKHEKKLTHDHFMKHGFYKNIGDIMTKFRESHDEEWIYHASSEEIDREIKLFLKDVPTDLPPTIVLEPKYVYHTTAVLDSRSEMYWDENADEGVPTPAYGHYHTSVHPGKTFTLDEKSDYNSPWTGTYYVFLRYKVQRPLKLLDIRELNQSDYCNVNPKLIDSSFDGIYLKQDNLEVELCDPESVLAPTCEQIPFATDECD